MLNTESAANYAINLYTYAELVSSVIENDNGQEVATVVLMVRDDGAMVEEIVSVWIEDGRIYGEF